MLVMIILSASVYRLVTKQRLVRMRHKLKRKRRRERWGSAGQGDVVPMSSGGGAFLLSKLLAQSGCNEMGAQRPLDDSCILSFQKYVYIEYILLATDQKVFLHVAFFCTFRAQAYERYGYIRFISVDDVVDTT